VEGLLGMAAIGGLSTDTLRGMESKGVLMRMTMNMDGENI
jgi:hypothetical protein